MCVMQRAVLARLLLVIGLLAGCAALALNIKPVMGLDLKGGVQFVLQAKPSDGIPATAENTDKVIEVLNRRINGLGVSEPNVYRSGENKIIVELAGVTDPKEAEQVIGTTAQLTIAPSKGPAPADGKLTADQKKAGDRIVTDESGGKMLVGKAVIKGTEITKASARAPDASQAEWGVDLTFSGTAKGAWQELTKSAACARDQGATDGTNTTPIILDDQILSAPQPVAGNVTCESGMSQGSVSITGNFNADSAKQLAMLIEGGSLPLKIDIVQRSTIGPTLGDAAITASWQAGLIGLILTALFITGVYRLVGFTATLALSSYALLSYAMLVTLGSTLTLPGLAGFVLAIGLAIDANVLVFERAREEYLANPGAGLRRALGIGFNKAWSAIMDSNVTTLLAAVLLFFLGTGPIKGFGVTLIIGTVASMVSALVIARVFTEVVLSIRGVQRRPRISGIAHQSKVRAWLDGSNIHIMRHRAKWLGVSLAALAIAGLGIAVNGLNMGVEFTGGRSLQYSTVEKPSIDSVREQVSEGGFPTATVQAGSDDTIMIRLGEVSDAEVASVQSAVEKVGGKTTEVANELVSGTYGNEILVKAMWAFGLAFFAQLIYLAFRFKWTFGLSAVLAMAHDVFLVVGLFAWLQKPIDGIFVAAAMTIIGLSVNDTVVVFDRIRERWQNSKPGANFSDEANRACLETVPRTVNTGLGAMFILGALAVLGGDSLQDFAIALLVGLIVGTYSSTFTATPMVTYLHEKWPMTNQKKVKKVREDHDSGAVV